MATTAKASKMSAELADRLAIRLPGLALVQSTDASGNPVITIGAGSPGGENAVIRTIPVAWSLATDILGNTANIYTPHTMQVCVEANPAAGAGADPVPAGDLAKLLVQVSEMGTIVELYNTASGTAPTVAGIIPGNLKTTINPDPRYPLISAQ